MRVFERQLRKPRMIKIRNYLWQCACVAFKSSWAGATGLIGTILGGLATTLLGSIHFINDATQIGKALNGAITTAIYAVGAWLIIFIIRTLFVSPFELWNKEVRLNSEILDKNRKDRLLYGLAVTAEVDDQFITGGKKLIGRIILKNTSNEPLQYGPANFSASFQNGDPIKLAGKETVLRPKENVHYKVEFDEKAMAVSRATIIFRIDIDYGLVTEQRIRRLHKEILVSYSVNDSKYISEQSARNIEDRDMAL
jgi:hypothetical protein